MDKQLQLATRNLIARGTGFLSQEEQKTLLRHLMQNPQNRSYALEEKEKYTAFEATVEFLLDNNDKSDILAFSRNSLWVMTHRVYSIDLAIRCVCGRNLWSTQVVFRYTPPRNACEGCLESDERLDLRYGLKYKHLLEKDPNG